MQCNMQNRQIYHDSYIMIVLHFILKSLDIKMRINENQYLHNLSFTDVAEFFK